MLSTHMSNASVLNLNSVLLESPAILTESYAQETAAAICHGIRNKDVSNSILQQERMHLSHYRPSDQIIASWQQENIFLCQSSHLTMS